MGLTRRFKERKVELEVNHIGKVKRQAMLQLAFLLSVLSSILLFLFSIWLICGCLIVLI